MAIIPTIKIVHATRGWCVINEADFDAKTQVKFSDKPAKVTKPAAKFKTGRKGAK